MSSAADTQLDDFFGTPSYNSKGAKDEKIKAGDNIYRILPPLGNLAKDGQWAVQYRIHWGWNGKVNKFAPFRCIERSDFKTKVITQACPACDKYRTWEKDKKIAKEGAEAKGMPSTDMKEFLAPFESQLQKHNLDKKYHMNALTQTGDVVVLKIGWNHWKALKAELDTLAARKPPIDGIAVNQGVFFNFHRVQAKNEGFTDTVKVIEEFKVIDGGTYGAPKLSPLTQENKVRVRKDYKQLDEMYRVLSYDQIKTIVDSGGNPDVIDTVLGVSEGTQHASSEEAFENDALPPAPTPQLQAPGQQVATQPPPAAPAAPAALSAAEQVAALQAQLAALQGLATAPVQSAPVTPTVAQGPAPTQTAAVPPAASAGMSDDTFLSSFGKRPA